MTCLEKAEDAESDADMATYYRITAQKARHEVIRILGQFDENELKTREDAKWIYATQSNILRASGNDAEADEAEANFYKLTDIAWEREAFNNTKDYILHRRSRDNNTQEPK